MPQVYDPAPPAYIPPAPQQPLPEPPSYQAGTGKGHWGYTGTDGGVGTPTGGGGGQSPFPWGAFNAANEQSQQAAESGLNQLLQFGSQGPYGQGLMNIFNSPYGLPPELMAQQRRMLAETSAGSRENALRRSKQSANASGFGNSLGAIRAQDQIRTESAADLNNANTQLSIQDALLGMQRQMGAGGLYNSLYGTDAGLRQAYASGQLGRQFPIAPGGMGGQGGGAPYGQSGGYMPSQPGPSGAWWMGAGGLPGSGTFDPSSGGYTSGNPFQPW